MEPGDAPTIASAAPPKGHFGGLSEFPVQPSKVQAPPLREETLARDRLLEWLSTRIHRRVVLLTAEAGYGKTTLLADFSRRTRLRVHWYRLDRGDRDWVGFLAHLVAALRIHQPAFGAATASLLAQTATAAPQLDAVLDTFLRELASVGGDPAAIVFDDFHLVDDSPEIRHVIRELLGRGPERMSLVFASRREPPIRLARLRALGEVSELRTDDLRFDQAETERLFRETYSMRLEPGVLAELSRRTEGWAASLQLVRAALHDRSPSQVRAFVSSLSGAEGHLYDYLAEEVIGELPDDLQQFLMRTSLLETVDLGLGPVAASTTEDETRRLIADAERHGLLGRGGPSARDQARAHPLVRDFLQARLARAIGSDGLREIHRGIARAAEGSDWAIASRHYAAAGDLDAAGRVLTGAIETILATGSYAAAHEIATSLGGTVLDDAATLVLRSRLAQQAGAVQESLAIAERAHRSDPTSMAAVFNLIGARGLAGDVPGALDAGRLLEAQPSPRLASLARVYRLLIETSVSAPLNTAVSSISEVIVGLRADGQTHFLGVALCNEAQLLLAIGDADAAYKAAAEAITLLESTGSAIELVSAQLAAAMALAHLGNLEAARAELAVVSSKATAGQALEIAAEAAELEAIYGDAGAALSHVVAVDAPAARFADNGDRALLARALANARLGRFDEAQRDLDEIIPGLPRSTPAFELRRQLAIGLLRVLQGKRPASELRDAMELARRQGSRLWGGYAHLLSELSDSTRDPSDLIVQLASSPMPLLNVLAEALIGRLGDLSPAAMAAVERSARVWPWRWRLECRQVLARQSSAGSRAAVLLSHIGETTDIGLLRNLGRRFRSVQPVALARHLARRLAPRVDVQDLGRVRVHVGDRAVEGHEVRRKVLALLCFLLTRPRAAATKEEVIENLWPDVDPGSALNSLNQTMYFLRRVFEPDFRDETTPGYVEQDGETIWLDSDLVTARSQRCLELIRTATGDTIGDRALELAWEYTGRFALEFSYEEWASGYRDALHAGFLRVLEQAIRLDVDSGRIARGALLAERATAVDPDSEDLQLALIRIYRLGGAHAAAAEQYGSYARVMHDLGLQPRPFAEL